MGFEEGPRCERSRAVMPTKASIFVARCGAIECAPSFRFFSCFAFLFFLRLANLEMPAVLAHFAHRWAKHICEPRSEPRFANAPALRFPPFSGRVRSRCNPAQLRHHDGTASATMQAIAAPLWLKSPRRRVRRRGANHGRLFAREALGTENLGVRECYFARSRSGSYRLQ
jgi:hypothetical protein